MDEEEADAIEEAFDHDYDVAQQFRSHIIPKGVLWFTGEAMNDALDGTYDGEDNLLNSKMQGVSMMDNDTGNNNTSEGGPFPPSASGLEEPECKQS
jgi:Nucleosome assembly protein (NAP).